MSFFGGEGIPPADQAQMLGLSAQNAILYVYISIGQVFRSDSAGELKFLLDKLMEL